MSQWLFKRLFLELGHGGDDSFLESLLTAHPFQECEIKFESCRTHLSLHCISMATSTWSGSGCVMRWSVWPKAKWELSSVQFVHETRMST